MNAYLTNGKKISFGGTVFDEMGQPIFTHDIDAQTVQMGPGYSLLDENGDPIGGGASVSEPANQIVYGTGSGVDSSAGFLFDPNLVLTNAGTNSVGISRIYTAAAMEDFPIAAALDISAITSDANITGLYGISVVASMNSAVDSSGYVTGISGSAIFTGNDSDFFVTGLRTEGTLSSATAGIVYGINASVSVAGSIVVDSVVLGITQSISGMSTVTNAYGVNIGNISGATNNYAIKTGTGAVDFGSEVRAGGDVSGAASRTTLTNATNSTTTNAYVVAGGQTAATENTGWLKIYVGTTPAWIPYWANATP